ncbi:methyltransferase [Deinococcus sp.]|uniref:methyltransferase n=1 Tax=Deinococcus sp. TaxID=47478 RepID=UPI00391BEAFD
MAGALGLTLVAQVQMGASWRIGLERARTALVQSGVFARSRNPIFLAMRLMLLGLFLAAPQAVTLTLLVVGEVLMQVQVRLEEAYFMGKRTRRTAHGSRAGCDQGGRSPALWCEETAAADARRCVGRPLVRAPMNSRVKP